MSSQFFFTSCHSHSQFSQINLSNFPCFMIFIPLHLLPESHHSGSVLKEHCPLHKVLSNLQYGTVAPIFCSHSTMGQFFCSIITLLRNANVSGLNALTIAEVCPHNTDKISLLLFIRFTNFPTLVLQRKSSLLFLKCS